MQKRPDCINSESEVSVRVGGMTVPLAVMRRRLHLALRERDRQMVQTVFAHTSAIDNLNNYVLRILIDIRFALQR